MRAAEVVFPTFDNAVLGVVPQPGRMDELHLYHGSRCNRACAFCCVNGAPEGYHIPFTEKALRAAVALVARHGSLKIYGGEPTLDSENLRWTICRLRALGFEGAITIFSNGLRPRLLIELLDSDARVLVVLNYAIATGTGEKPLPRRTFIALAEYEARNPGRIYLSHDFVVPVGRQGAPAALGPSDSPARCFRCYPTLTGAGELHACPFAVEVRHPHYALGDLTTSPDEVRARFARFLTWIGETLESAAALRRENPCAVCAGLNPPAFPSANPSSRTVPH